MSVDLHYIKVRELGDTVRMSDLDFDEVAQWNKQRQGFDVLRKVVDLSDKLSDFLKLKSNGSDGEAG